VTFSQQLQVMGEIPAWFHGEGAGAAATVGNGVPASSRPHAPWLRARPVCNSGARLLGVHRRDATRAPCTRAMRQVPCCRRRPQGSSRPRWRDCPTSPPAPEPPLRPTNRASDRADSRTSRALKLVHIRRLSLQAVLRRPSLSLCRASISWSTGAGVRGKSRFTSAGWVIPGPCVGASIRVAV
jgi:hypothetical protein